MLLQLATTKFGCVTMFEVGVNTCNNAFQLAINATMLRASWKKMLPVLPGLNEGPMLETLDYTIHIGSTPIFLYFDLHLYSAYAAHYVYYFKYYHKYSTASVFHSVNIYRVARELKTLLCRAWFLFDPEPERFANRRVFTAQERASGCARLHTNSACSFRLGTQTSITSKQLYLRLLVPRSSPVRFIRRIKGLKLSACERDFRF